MNDTSNGIKPIINDLPEADDIDKMLKIDIEKFESLSDDDKKYVKVQQGMMYAQSMNVIRTTIFQIEEDIKHRLLTTVDNIKIISSRIADIKEDKINELDINFINDLFTIDGEKIKVRVPELGEFNESEYINDVEFYKLLISYIKIYDKNLADSKAWLAKVEAKFIENVEPEIREIVQNTSALSEFMDSYLKRKLEDPNVSEEQKETIKNCLLWTSYGTTLDPIYNNIKEQFDAKGSLSSLFHNYRNNLKSVVEGAYKVCDNLGMRYPYKLIDDIESKIFTEEELEEYKNYKFLFMYIVSRYIKYLGSSVKPFEQIFLNQLISNLVVMAKTNPDESTIKVRQEMKPHIKKILDFVIKHQK